jgi:hypothetical protein
MKLVKMLGLAAVAAAALMAFIGAGTASAAGTVCSTATNPCTSRWATPTAMEFSLKSGTSARLTTTAGETLDTCTSSTVSGKLETNTGGATTATGTNTSITWGSCTVTTDTILPGKLTVSSAGGGAGSVAADATIEVTINIFGTTCNYGVNSGTSLGTISEGTGSGAVFTANAVAKKLNGNFLCPETTKWAAEYVLTKPSATTFYVSTS